MEDSEIIIFDFDGTLVSNDTGYEFYKWLIKDSAVRTSLFTLTAPLWMLLLLNSHSKLLGMNIVSFIATFYQSRSLLKLRSEFIHYYFSSAGAKAYSDGIKELHQHQENGKSVAIISGCPKWLLYGVTKHLKIKNVTLLGSTCCIKGYALVFKQHCYHTTKIEMARESGLLRHKWSIGYSDSKADIPMLKKCSVKVLINVPQDKVDQFTSNLSGELQERAWS